MPRSVIPDLQTVSQLSFLFKRLRERYFVFVAFVVMASAFYGGPTQT